MTLRTFLLLALAAPLCVAQNPGSKSSSPPRTSQRQQAGLRGPVKTCVEETTYPETTGPNGLESGPFTRQSETDYDLEGHILAVLNRNSDGSIWADRSSYAASGKLLKTTSGKEGGPAVVTTYAYDDQGRLTSISPGNGPAVTFRIDEHGHKTKVQTSRAEDYRQNVAKAGSPFSVADMPPNLQGGGSAITKYDQDDRPTEVEVHDAQGELVSRTVRAYDPQGSVTEEKQILEDPLKILPADARAQIAGTPGQGDELRAQLVQLMGGHEGPSSIAYTYDVQGRITETVHQFFNRVDKVETTYNDQGDVAAEKTLSTQAGEPDPEFQSPETHYLYHYDQHGNWTEKTTSYSTSARAFESAGTTRRTLTYF